MNTPETSASHPPVALVTGASSGVGAATVRILAEQGYTVVGCDVSDPRVDGPDYIESDRVEHVRLDVADPVAAQRVVDDLLERHGRIDLLANVAGINDGVTAAHHMPDAIWNKVLAIDLSGPFYLIRAVLPTMMEQRSGSIVNVSSIAGILGSVSGAAYTAAKHGLVGLTKSVAAMYRGHNIRCNVICPGSVVTNIRETDSATDPFTEDLRKVWTAKSNTPAQPTEVADAIAYFASPASRSVSGVVFPLDGGWTA